MKSVRSRLFFLQLVVDFFQIEDIVLLLLVDLLQFGDFGLQGRKLHLRYPAQARCLCHHYLKIPTIFRLDHWVMIGGSGPFARPAPGCGR